ncbi:MAG: DUF3458 domain-containing protein, partial [Clostridia bacterium]|nr:DUF3458 domain-containing protein [Clostridia bacterium]
LHTLLGADTFRRGMDIYFERHDGQAVTCDDFVAAMETAWGRDLTRFKRWYSQAGTPELTVAAEYDAAGRQLVLTVEQTCPPTRETAEKLPFTMPLAVGLLDEQGRTIPLEEGTNPTTRILVLSEARQRFVFDHIATRPTVSFLRNFSAPVKVRFEQSEEELSRMMAFDPDPFNRWDAGQKLALRFLLEQIEGYRQGRPITVNEQLINGLRNLLLDRDSDQAFLAMALALPSENWIGQQMEEIDPVAVYSVRQQFRALIARALRIDMVQCYDRLHSTEAYRYSAHEAGRRSLRNTCLAYLLAPTLEGELEPCLLQRGVNQYRQADNMTDTIAALGCVVNADLDTGKELLADFHAKWHHDPLVVDKWLILQAGCTLPGTLDRVRALTSHPSFTYKNLTLSFFIQTVQGAMRNNTHIGMASDELERRNSLADIGYWTPENKSNEWRSLSKNSNPHGYGFPVKTNYTRIKDVTLSYALPQTMVDQIGLGALSFYLSGRNLYTFTDWIGWDPEERDTARGLNNWDINYPSVRSFVFGINLTL